MRAIGACGHEHEHEHEHERRAARCVFFVGRAGRRLFWPAWLYDAPVVGPVLWRRVVRRGFTAHMPP